MSTKIFVVNTLVWPVVQSNSFLTLGEAWDHVCDHRILLRRFRAVHNRQDVVEYNELKFPDDGNGGRLFRKVLEDDVTLTGSNSSLLDLSIYELTIFQTKFARFYSITQLKC